MAGGGLAAEDEVFFAEDADPGGGGYKPDGDADEEGHHWHGLVVDCGAEDFVIVEEEALEVVALLAVLGEPDQETAEGCDAHFKPEGGEGAVLLPHRAREAEVVLAPQWSAAAFDGGLEAGGLGFGGERVVALARGLRGFLIFDERFFGDITGPFVWASVTGDDVGDDVAGVAVFWELEPKGGEERACFRLSALENETSVA